MDPLEETALRLFERNARPVERVNHMMHVETLSVLKEIRDELKTMNKPTPKVGRPKKE